MVKEVKTLFFDEINGPDFPGLDIIGEPKFEIVRYRDINPLGGYAKNRWLYKPNKAMREVHRRFLAYLRSGRILWAVDLRHATACRRGCSPREHVRWHRYNRFFYVMDLADAYRAVDGKKLTEIICQLDLDVMVTQDKVYSFLERYCLAKDGGLATGAPCSPDLFNLYAAVLLDDPISDVCKKHDIRYSRYLDDLTFSSRLHKIGKWKREQLRGVITEVGFSINHLKVKSADLYREPVVICGVGLEYGGRMFVPRGFVKTVRGLVHRAEKYGDVDPFKIHGLMGVFKSITGRRPFNRTEQRLIDLYQNWRDNAEPKKAL